MTDRQALSATAPLNFEGPDKDDRLCSLLIMGAQFAYLRPWVETVLPPDVNGGLVVTQISHTVLTLSIAIAAFLALLAAVATEVLSRLDGASWPAAVLRAGAAFVSTLTLAALLIALYLSA